MNNQMKSLLQWSFVMLIALFAAFWASIPTDEKAQEKVKITHIDHSEIKSVVLRTKEGSKELLVKAFRRPELSERWWITSEQSDLAAGSNIPLSQERFLASGKFKDMLRTFAPLYGLRSLGKISNDQMQEFGLAESAKTLTISGDGDAEILRLGIGKQLYGSKNIYVLNHKDQTVWLISGEFVTDFEKPEVRAFERLLMEVSLEEVQSATLTWGEKKREFNHTKKDSKGTLIWTAAEDEAAPVPSAMSWFERLWSLRAAMYATDEIQTKLMALPVLAEIKIVAGNSMTEELQIRQLTIDGNSEYWVTSKFLSWNAKVTSVKADGLVKDLGQLFAK